MAPTPNPAYSLNIYDLQAKNGGTCREDPADQLFVLSDLQTMRTKARCLTSEPICSQM